MKKQTKNKKGRMAITQIAILVVAIFATTWMISEVSSNPPTPIAVGGPWTALKDGFTAIYKGIWNSISNGIFGAEGLFKETLWTFGEGQSATSMTVGGALNAVINAAVIAAVTYIASYVIARELFGAEVAQAKGIGYAAGIAVGGYYLASTLLQFSLSFIQAAGIIGLVAFLLYEFVFEKDIDAEIVVFRCEPWVAEYGGENCELCNNAGFPCTEYTCKSLGRSCELVNEESIDDARCVWMNRNDISPPVINPWENALFQGYYYEDEGSSSGVFLRDSDTEGDCLSPGKKVAKAGITLDEPAECRYSFEQGVFFDEMENKLSDGIIDYNHSVLIPLYNQEGTEMSVLGNDIHIKCKDNNGNENIADFIISYCIKDVPDWREPEIIAALPDDKSYIKFNQDSMNVEFYIDSPSECNWSLNNVPADTMENKMECKSEFSNVLEGRTAAYVCKTNITGLQNYEANQIYVRCQKYANREVFPNLEESERVPMEDAYIYTLYGSRPLGILEAEPNKSLIKSASGLIRFNLSAKTFAGAEDNGNAWCEFKDANETNYALFMNTGDTYMHTNTLSLSPGEYTYNIRCTDRASNVAYTNVSFTLESDTTPPKISRVFTDSSKNINIITNEKAKCKFHTSTCAFLFETKKDSSLQTDSEGILLQTDSEGITHSVDWETASTIYIKCEDEYGNQPSPEKCTIILRPEEFGFE